MDDTTLTREFLATHHAPCPACGFDLHGLATTACPECGATFELEIRRAEFSRRHARLVVTTAAAVTCQALVSVTLGAWSTISSWRSGLPTRYALYQGVHALIAGISLIVIGLALIRVLGRGTKRGDTHARLLVRTLWVVAAQAVIVTLAWALTMLGFY